MSVPVFVGERPEAGSTVEGGQTANIGFWQNKNGQSLIRSLSGGADSKQRGNWLATTFHNMYAGLAGMSNEQVADHYVSLFKRNKQTAPDGPPKLDAQTLAVALAVYVTSEPLAGTTASSYGFTVTQHGVGCSTFNVGDNGAAFGAANGAEMTVLDLLLATNARTKSGLLYDQNGDGTIEAATREAEGKPPAKTDPQDAVPDPKAQRNFTDPESKILKTSSKGWDQCGNAQAVVNENQIIVAADVTDQANDVRQVDPMLNLTISNIDQAGVTENITAFAADAGYFSESNVAVLEEHERVDEA